MQIVSLVSPIILEAFAYIHWINNTICKTFRPGFHSLSVFGPDKLRGGKTVSFFLPIISMRIGYCALLGMEGKEERKERAGKRSERKGRERKRGGKGQKTVIGRTWSLTLSFPWFIEVTRGLCNMAAATEYDCSWRKCLCFPDGKENWLQYGEQNQVEKTLKKPNLETEHILFECWWIF